MGDAEGFPPHHEVEFYRLYRERIVTEDTLLFQRLSWLITAQTVMFSFTAIAFFRGGPGQIDTAGTLLMSVLGVVMCSLGGLGVWAASHRIDEVKEAQFVVSPDRKKPGARKEKHVVAGQPSPSQTDLRLCLSDTPAQHRPKHWSSDWAT